MFSKKPLDALVERTQKFYMFHLYLQTETVLCEKRRIICAISWKMFVVSTPLHWKNCVLQICSYDHENVRFTNLLLEYVTDVKTRAIFK